MSSIQPTSVSVFSVPLEHQWRVDFCGDSNIVQQRATGLDRFIGDQANKLLRYLATDHFVTELLSPDNGDGGFATFTPIVFSGPSGTGKTSLAMALASKLTAAIERNENHQDNLSQSKAHVLSFHQNDIKNNDENRWQATKSKPVYMTGADFARRFYTAIDTDTVKDFRKSILQSCAVIIDDVQQLANKMAAQRELETVLDLAVGQCVPFFVISNVSPTLTDGFSERLISRLSSGLTIPFHPPGADARVRIVNELAKIHNIALTDCAQQFLYQRFEVTVPRLEQLFQQITLKLRFDQKEQEKQKDSDITVNPVIDSATLESLIAPNDDELLQMMRFVQKRVAKEFKLKLNELTGNSRKQTIVLARCVAIYLIRCLLPTSFQKIGTAFGNRDHSTILHSFRKIDSYYQSQNDRLTDLENEPRCSSDSSKHQNLRLTLETKKTMRLVSHLKQELTDRFAMQIGFH